MTTRLFFLVGFILVSFTSKAQSERTPLEVVQKQLDTYNAQDIEGFAALFSEEAQVFYNLGDSQPTLVGRDEVHAKYGELFTNNPQNKSVLKGRLVQGNYVFDHEWITGRAEGFSIVAIYEVKEGLIQRCWFVR